MGRPKGDVQLAQACAKTGSGVRVSLGQPLARNATHMGAALTYNSRGVVSQNTRELMKLIRPASRTNPRDKAQYQKLPSVPAPIQAGLGAIGVELASSRALC